MSDRHRPAHEPEPARAPLPPSHAALSRIGADAAFVLASEDPLQAMRALCRAARSQSTGARLMLVAEAVRGLAQGDPTFTAAVVADLQRGDA